MVKCIDRGGCADIFEMSGDRVMKAYRRRAHTSDVRTPYWPDHNAITRAQFRAEALAYEQIQNHAALELYVPRYFGRVDPAQQLRLPPSDETYVSGCGLIVERIPGRAKKLAHLEKSVEELVSLVMEQIRDTLGLDQVWDASCFVPGLRAAFTVIDFALWDAEEYEMALADRGTLTSQERAKLELENVG